MDSWWNLEQWGALWRPALALAHGLLALLVTGHVVLAKRDARAAMLWVGLIWLAPFMGAALYLLIGINRIHRREVALRRGQLEAQQPALPSAMLPWSDGALLPLAETGHRVVRRPLVAGNSVTPLPTGDVAFPAMLDAITQARRSVALCTYIFDVDPWGVRFIDALAQAHARGVQVRVLIDAVGARYSWPRGAPRTLRARGVPVARFLALRLPLDVPLMNMRDHRKVMVVDGTLGFTGGMNIRAGHVLGDQPAHPVHDVHFRIEGPVVGQLLGSFREDWRFTAGEDLDGPAWAVSDATPGAVLARVITDGPDEDFERLRWMYIAAVNAAQHSVRIVTPYFVPDQGLLGVIAAAALRGVQVDIVLPARSNLRVVDWATRALLWQVLEYGCRVWATPPPFDHSKLLVVDGRYVMFGSGNWDARTTRLNFELDVECFGEALAAEVGASIDARIAKARPVLVQEVQQEPLWARLRNGVARLLSPYL